MQANFWKLLNNTNFGFDCKYNSQTTSLQLIYNEQAEIEFKYRIQVIKVRRLW